MECLSSAKTPGVSRSLCGRVRLASLEHAEIRRSAASVAVTTAGTAVPVSTTTAVSAATAAMPAAAGERCGADG